MEKPVEVSIMVKKKHETPIMVEKTHLNLILFLGKAGFVASIPYFFEVETCHPPFLSSELLNRYTHMIKDVMYPILST